MGQFTILNDFLIYVANYLLFLLATKSHIISYSTFYFKFFYTNVTLWFKLAVRWAMIVLVGFRKVLI